MFSFAGIVALLLLIFIRPMEIFPVLQAVPWLYIFFGLAVFGLVVDLRLRIIQPQATPQLVWVLLFFAWGVVDAVLRAVSPGETIFMMAILFVWYYLVSHGLSGLKPFKWVYGIVLVLSVYISMVAVHQHFADTGCVEIEGMTAAGEPSSNGIPDGRSCDVARECYTNDAEPGREYLCEKIGLFGTSSITKRVRYLGIFQDPNDLSLTVACALPFLLAMVLVRPTARRIVLASLGGAIIVLAILFSRSRGGQLVLLAIVGCYFVRRYGIKGAIVAAVAGAPVLLIAMGGRGDEASESSSRRIEHMYEGMMMFRASPLLGVGPDQFTEHHYQTAHNSYVLTLAETGIVGMFFWISILYTTMKIPVVALLRYRNGELPEGAEEVPHWAMATISSLVGTYIGIFFLSFTWHYMLWCYKGIAGALYRAIRTHDPGLEVRFGFLDLVLVVGLTVGITGGLYVLASILIAGVA